MTQEIPEPSPSAEVLRAAMVRLDALEAETWRRAKEGHGDDAVDLWIKVCRLRQKAYGLDGAQR